MRPRGLACRANSLPIAPQFAQGADEGHPHHAVEHRDRRLHSAPGDGPRTLQTVNPPVNPSGSATNDAIISLCSWFKKSSRANPGDAITLQS